MSNKITYIVAGWLGPRRANYYTQKFFEDPYFLIKQHIINLSVLGTDNIEKILIVINENDHSIDYGLQNELSKLNCSIPYEILIRPNLGFSYAAWNHGICYCLENKTTSDYFFLIEDDYVPIRSDFHEYFLHNFSNNDIGAVFQLYVAMHGLQKHAAISNGMIKRDIAEKCVNIHNSVFKLRFEQSYASAQDNQVIFLDYIRSQCEITDISKSVCIPFYDVNVKRVVNFGKTKGDVPIHPIYELNLFQFHHITEHDAEFINFIRNSYCDEYLHDSRKFTVEETRSWITETNPLYFIVTYGNQPIGYFRLSNHSEENKNIYIGADIHPKYVGLKLAYPMYMSFINFIFDYKQLNKLTLEVLETNTRAINLYKKLGFVYEGQKRKEVLKNDKYVDSIIMSILKEEWNNENF